MLRVALSLGCLLAVASASGLPYGMMEPTLEDLYRLRLYDDPYLAYLPLDSRSDDAMPDAGAAPLWAEARGVDMGDAAGAVDGVEDEDMYANVNSPLYPGAQARDEEHLEHSALQGLHAVAGGTAEGQPPQKQVKTDKPLPAYCNPPNPCPIGKTADDNCIENFENSMENNKQLLKQQDCPCDTEHMFSCPAGQQTVTSKGAGGQAALNKVMSELAQLQSDGDLSLIAETADNPYFAGTHNDIRAKKSPIEYPGH